MHVDDKPAMYVYDKPARYVHDKPTRYVHDKRAMYVHKKTARLVHDKRKPAMYVHKETARHVHDKLTRYVTTNHLQYPFKQTVFSFQHVIVFGILLYYYPLFLSISRWDYVIYLFMKMDNKIIIPYLYFRIDFLHWFTNYGNNYVLFRSTLCFRLSRGRARSSLTASESSGTVVTWESPPRRGRQNAAGGTVRTMVLSSPRPAPILRRSATLRVARGPSEPSGGGGGAAGVLLRYGSAPGASRGTVRAHHSRNSSVMSRTSSRHGRIIRLEQKATKVLNNTPITMCKHKGPNNKYNPFCLNWTKWT